MMAGEREGRRRGKRKEDVKGETGPVKDNAGIEEAVERFESRIPNVPLSSGRQEDKEYAGKNKERYF